MNYACIQLMRELFERFVEKHYGHLPTCNECGDEWVEELSKSPLDFAKQALADLASTKMSDADFIERVNSQVEQKMFRTGSRVYITALGAIMHALTATGRSKLGKAIDLGSGLGILPHFLQDTGLVNEVLGVEPARAYRENPDMHIPCIASNPVDTGLPGESADLALSIDVVSICFGWRRLVKEMCRLVKPGGIIVIAYFYGDGRVDISPTDLTILLAQQGIDVLIAEEMDLNVGVYRNVVSGIKRKPKGILPITFSTDPTSLILPNLR